MSDRSTHQDCEYGFVSETRDLCCVPTPLIQTEALTLHYGNKPAFQEVSLPINKGCVTALVGPSGCGKTSFLMTLNRLTDLVPAARISGQLRIGDQNVLDPGLDVVQHRRRIGMIFQKPNPFALSIRRNIEFPLREHGVKSRAAIDDIMEIALCDVGLWDEVKDRLDTPALALSGGQQQRLCIARALALKPEVLLLDEPCSALDPISSGVVEDRISSLRSRYTIVIVTHNLAQARRISDWTALFWVQGGAGRLIEFGSARQIFEAPQEPITTAYISGIRG